MSENAKRKDVVLPTTDNAIRMAKSLLRTARSGVLATIEPGTGWPIATRVGVSTDFDGTPMILISRLAAHTPALLADPRCSLLLGTPGKGDPLAHVRMSIACEARKVERDSAEHQRLDSRYLSHQQKATLYSTLPDFHYFLLAPKSASLNGGFGKAFALTPAELLSRTGADAELAATEPGVIEHMNADHGDAVGHYAEYFARAPAGKWKLLGVDVEGMDLADGDDIRRVWFAEPLSSAKDLHMILVRLAGEARHALDDPPKDGP